MTTQKTIFNLSVAIFCFSQGLYASDPTEPPSESSSSSSQSLKVREAEEYACLQAEALPIIQDLKQKFVLNDDDLIKLEEDFRAAQPYTKEGIYGEITNIREAERTGEDKYRMYLCFLATHLFFGRYGEATEDQLGIAVSLYVKAASLNYAPAIYKLGELGKDAGFLSSDFEGKTLKTYAQKIKDPSVEGVLGGLGHE